MTILNINNIVNNILSSLNIVLLTLMVEFDDGDINSSSIS